MTLATVDADGVPNARMVLLKGVDQRGFVFYTNMDSQKGRELDAQSEGGAGVSLEIAEPAGARARAGRARHRRRSRRLFRHAAEAGPDRRLGEQAVAAAGKPACLREGGRASTRPNTRSARAAAAELVGLPHRAAARSNSGTTGRSACTTASSSAARLRRAVEQGAALSMSYMLRLRQPTSKGLNAEHAKQPAAPHAAADRSEPRHRARDGEALLRRRLARHHLLAASVPGKLPVGRGTRRPHPGRSCRRGQHQRGDRGDQAAARSRRTARAGQQRGDFAQGRGRQAARLARYHATTSGTRCSR